MKHVKLINALTGKPFVFSASGVDCFISILAGEETLMFYIPRNGF